MGGALLCCCLLYGCGPVAIEYCQSTDAIHVVCGLNKPEDIAHLAGTGWLLISELGSGSSPGQVVAYRPRDDRLIPLRASDPPLAQDASFQMCGPPPESIRPRGFHLRTGDDGVAHLLLVNVASEARIERYVVDTSREVPGLLWEGCVSVPDTLNPNDVAALKGNGLVISHMFTPPMDLLLRSGMFFGRNTGYVARWRPEDGWGKIPSTDVSFPNGIETDPESDRVFVAATYGETLTAVDGDGGNARTTSLPIQPDNLSWSPDGRLLAVGHTGVPILGTDGCRDMGDRACAFPFAVAAIDPQSMKVDVIYAHGDGMIPGPSVALRYERFLFLGTFFGDRISRVAVADGG